MTKLVAKMKFVCCGCGRRVDEEEIIEDFTQEILEICNDCTDRPFSEYVNQPFSKQSKKGFKELKPP